MNRVEHSYNALMLRLAKYLGPWCTLCAVCNATEVSGMSGTVAPRPPNERAVHPVDLDGSHG
jgi:hypothetical protein